MWKPCWKWSRIKRCRVLIMWKSQRLSPALAHLEITFYIKQSRSSKPIRSCRIALWRSSARRAGAFTSGTHRIIGKKTGTTRKEFLFLEFQHLELPLGVRWRATRAHWAHWALARFEASACRRPRSGSCAASWHIVCFCMSSTHPPPRPQVDGEPTLKEPSFATTNSLWRRSLVPIQEHLALQLRQFHYWFN